MGFLHERDRQASPRTIEALFLTPPPRRTASCRAPASIFRKGACSHVLRALPPGRPRGQLWGLGTPVSEELRTLLPTPSDLASRNTHQPRFEIPDPAATVGAITRRAQNARPGACEDTPRARPRPGRSPAHGRLGQASPNWVGAKVHKRDLGICLWVCKVSLREAVVIKTPDSPRDRGARPEVEPRWGTKRRGRWHLASPPEAQN